MTSRAEITTKYAKAYVKASKKGKGQILDRVVEVTGWSRDNARRRLTAAAKQPPGVRADNVANRPRRQTHPEVFLRRFQSAAKGLGGLGWAVWAVSGRLDGPAAGCIGTPQRAGASISDRYSSEVRAELLAMSSSDRSTATCGRRQGPRPNHGEIDH